MNTNEETANETSSNETSTPAEVPAKKTRKPATKKAKAKKVAKKAPAKKTSRKAVGTRTGSIYYISSKSKLPKDARSPQLTFIVEYLTKKSSAGATRQELALAAKKAGQKTFPCNQPYDRAVGFYLSKYKGLGAFNSRKVAA